jgi:hypothetical protein
MNNHAMLRTLIMTATLVSLTAPASAEIYKCRLPNGTTEISNVSCPSGSGTVTVRPDEPVSEASRRQAERDVDRMRDYVEKREAIQRAEEKAERDEQAVSQRQSSSVTRTPRNYGSAEECLRDVAQMTIETTQRAQMEADCRSIAKPQTVYVPVAVPYYPPRPQQVHPEPAPKPAPPSAPKISAPLLQK